MRLPSELQTVIAGYLNLQGLRALANVNQHFRKLLNWEEIHDLVRKEHDLDTMREEISKLDNFSRSILLEISFRTFRINFPTTLLMELSSLENIPSGPDKLLEDIISRGFFAVSEIALLVLAGGRLPSFQLEGRRTRLSELLDESTSLSSRLLMLAESDTMAPGEYESVMGYINLLEEKERKGKERRRPSEPIGGVQGLRHSLLWGGGYCTNSGIH